MVHVAMCCAHVWTHACMKCFLQAPVQVQQGLSGRLEAVWTKTKVKGHEVARLLCVSTNVCACVYSSPSLGNSMPHHAHMLLPHMKMKPYVLWRSTCEKWPLWEARSRLGKVLAQTSPTATLPKHTQSHWAIGCFFLWVICLKKCCVICFLQPDAPSAVGFLIKVW